MLDEKLESSESLQARVELVSASGQFRRIVVVDDEVTMTVLDCDDLGFGRAVRSGNAGAHGTLRSIGDEPLPRENAYGALRPAPAQQLTGRRPAMASLALLGKQD